LQLKRNRLLLLRRDPPSTIYGVLRAP
jgi:hypothetical protein